MTDPAHVVAFAVGLVVVVGTTTSVLRNLVVPRRLRSRLVQTVGRGVRLPYRFVADHARTYVRRDRVQAWIGPTVILVVLVTWLLLYLVGYGLLVYAVSATLPLRAAFREAGSSLFTLGFASTDRTQLTAVDFAAAITGPVVIGLQIGYLPALYAAYNRRESEVTMLESRAGEPNWGPEILARHSSISSVDNLRDLYRGWEHWAADVSESHSNYPVLIWFRSQEPTRSWVVALLSVMDSAALQLSLSPGLPQGEARLALRMGFSCLRDLARTTRIPFDPDPNPDDPIALTYDDFLLGVARLERGGFPMERTAAQAWPDFRGWRVNYESIAYALAERVDAVPALWSGPRRGLAEPVAPRTPVNRLPGGKTGAMS